MRYQLRSLILTVPIYKTKIKITFVDSIENYFQFKNYNCNININDCEALVYYAQNRDYHLDLIFENSGYRDDILVHELFHIIKYICDNVGIVLSDESEEAWAYLFGDLYGKIKYIIYNNLLKELDYDY